MGVCGTKCEALPSNVQWEIIIKWCLQVGACSCFIKNAPLATLDDIVLCMHPRVHNTCMLTRVQCKHASRSQSKPGLNACNDIVDHRVTTKWTLLRLRLHALSMPATFHIRFWLCNEGDGKNLNEVRISESVIFSLSYHAHSYYVAHACMVNKSYWDDNNY